MNDAGGEGDEDEIDKSIKEIHQSAQKLSVPHGSPVVSQESRSFPQGKTKY